MPIKPETKEIQSQLAQYCRDGKEVHIEGALDKRLPHYRRLVYNVMYGTLEKAFPICKSLLSEAEFKSMIDAYLTGHNAKEEQVWKVPGEFFSFIQNWDGEVYQNHPYLEDLLKMEWMEILVYNRENRDVPAFEERFSSDEPLVLNPDHEIIHLNYPVFRGEWEDITSKKGTYFLLLFRHLKTDKVQFMEISQLHEELIAMLMEGQAANKAIQKVAHQFGLHSDVKTFGILSNFLKSLHEKGFIVGTAMPQ